MVFQNNQSIIKEEISMNLNKKIATLALVGVLGASAVASAASVGVVTVNDVYNNYAGIGAIQMQVNKIDAEYGPKYDSERAKIVKLTDEKKQQEAAEKTLRPIMEARFKEIEKVIAPVDAKIKSAIETVAAEKKIDIIVLDPTNVYAITDGNTVVDLTKDVIDKVNK